MKIKIIFYAICLFFFSSKNSSLEDKNQAELPSSISRRQRLFEVICKSEPKQVNELNIEQIREILNEISLPISFKKNLINKLHSTLLQRLDISTLVLNALEAICESKKISELKLNQLEKMLEDNRINTFYKNILVKTFNNHQELEKINISNIKNQELMDILMQHHTLPQLIDMLIFTDHKRHVFSKFNEKIEKDDKITVKELEDLLLKVKAKNFELVSELLSKKINFIKTKNIISILTRILTSILLYKLLAKVLPLQTYLKNQKGYRSWSHSLD